MAVLTISIDADEFLGLSALAELDEAANGGRDDVAGTARTLIHGALAAKLDELGLPWAPSPGIVKKYKAEAAEPASGLLGLMKNDRLRRIATSVLLVTALVVLWGGYIQGWEWTGFRSNEQLWDWLRLLLLPVVIGTIPLWIEHSDYVSRGRRVIYIVGLAALTGLVVAGYLVPLNWTGFSGNTLWDWLELILLPVAVASARFLPSALRSLRPYHHGVIAVIVLGWAVTIIGGYALSWYWTGYQGNTLWDWLGLLLLPLLVPIVLVPTALQWTSSNAAQPARQARAVARAP